VFDHELLAHRRVFRKLGPNRLVHWAAGLSLLATYLLALLLMAHLVYRNVTWGWYIGEEFYWVSGLGLAAICLIAPAVTAPSLVSERQRGTWDLLRLSRISPRQIVLGKYFGRIALPTDLVLLTLPLLLIPVAAATRPEEAGRCLLATGVAWSSALIGFSSLGMWCSARAKSAAGAVATAYGLALLITFVFPVAELVFMELFEPKWYPPSDDGPPLSAALSPLVAWIVIAYHNSPWDLTEPIQLAATLHLPLWLLASVGFVTASIRHMTHATADEMRTILRRRRRL
jgi:ABC-type transport system involved in multi-copper enzyme maturation permease subunit